MCKELIIQSNLIGKYPIYLHEDCVYCNNPATQKRKYTFKRAKEVSKEMVGTTEKRTFLMKDITLNIPYCEEHYTMDKKLKKLNIFLKICSYLVPFSLFVVYTILAVSFGFFGGNETMNIIVAIVLGIGSLSGIMIYKDKLIFKKNKYGIALGILFFEFNGTQKNDDSMVIKFFNKDYASKFKSNNSCVKK